MRRASRTAVVGTVLSALAVAGVLNAVGPSAPGRAAYIPSSSTAPAVVQGTPAAAFHRADRPNRSADRPVISATAVRSEALARQSARIAKAAKKAEQAKRAAEKAKRAAAAKAAAEKAAAKRKQVAELGYDPAKAQSPQEIARAIMANKYGWGSGQYSCFNKVVMSESGWSVHATNPSSGAYGIMQALPGSKMASAGSDWRTNPATQIRWGLSYINNSYGTPCSAWSFHLSHGWY